MHDMIPKIHEVSTTKIMDFVQEKLGLDVPSGEKVSIEIIEANSPRLEDFWEDELNEINAEIVPAASKEKHISKLTKSELEGEFKKLGLPYVYSSTKDAARALIGIKERKIPIPPEESLVQRRESRYEERNDRNSEKPWQILNSGKLNSFETPLEFEQRTATLGLMMSETRQEINETRQNIDIIRDSLNQFEKPSQFSLREERKENLDRKKSVQENNDCGSFHQVSSQPQGNQSSQTPWNQFQWNQQNQPQWCRPWAQPPWNKP
ncbi:unnamed protein product [Bemisia tabaci]|uniref:Uncharacterized protein n=1 Tax=Bemisia tabaci TaxID=7038 RepID=A0A9P0F1D5_BEMTA|nr:unnamed protein product [Bemisia tabaci]